MWNSKYLIAEKRLVIKTEAVYKKAACEIENGLIENSIFLILRIIVDKHVKTSHFLSLTTFWWHYQNKGGLDSDNIL